MKMLDHVLKHWRIYLPAILVFLFLFLIGWIAALKWDKYAEAKVKEIEMEKAHVELINSELQKKYDELDAQFADKEKELDVKDKALLAKDKELEDIKKTIVALEKEKDDYRLSIRLADNNDAMLDSFKKHFPGIAKTKGFGVVLLEDDGLKEPYVMMPLYMIDQFEILKVEFDAKTKQIEQWIELEKTYGSIVDLHAEKESLLQEMVSLRTVRSMACNDVREELRAIYDRRADEHRTDLKKPLFDFGNNKVAAGIGFVAGGAAGWFLKSQSCGGNILRLNGTFD